MSITIKSNEIIPGLDHRAFQLPKKLTAAGIDVPPALRTGLDRARWIPALPDTAPYTARMAEATTEAEFQAAAHDLAQTTAVRTAMGSQGFKAMSDTYRLAAAEHAIRECGPDLLTTTVEGYNDALPEFVEALANVPDLQGVKSVYDLGPADAQALGDAKASASTLSTFLAVYCDLAFLTGHGDHYSPAPGSLPGALTLMTVLGSWDTGAKLNGAAEDVLRYRDGEGNHGALAPHCIPVWGGASEYRMALPIEAEQRHAAVRENWT